MRRQEESETSGVRIIGVCCCGEEGEGEEGEGEEGEGEEGEGEEEGEGSFNDGQVLLTGGWGFEEFEDGVEEEGDMFSLWMMTIVPDFT